MQMYKVEFTSRRGRAVETGTYLVCASNADQARDIVMSLNHLPPQATTFDVTRVKPSIYKLKHTDFVDQNFITGGGAMPVLNKSEDREGAMYEISVQAKVYAYSESSAIRKMLNAVAEQDSCGNAKPAKNIHELSLDVGRSELRVRPSRLEQQGVYSNRKIFAGGAARPR